MSSVPRKPEPSPPMRIAPLAALPVFHKLGGRKVVLAGDGEGALWKAELLLATGAQVQVFAPTDASIFDGLVRQATTQVSGLGTLHVHARRWIAADLAGAALAIAETADDNEATAFFCAAQTRGIPVNVIDRPAFCSFQFGGIVNRSPLIISISTDGAAPVFGQAIRAKIEALLPPGLQDWAQAARDWRPTVQARNLGFALRRRFWESFAALALREPGRTPTPDDQAALLRNVDMQRQMSDRGMVLFVGAGPGDPELLTLKAVRALQSADIILYDDLVSAAVLDLARREAKRMLVGKTGHGPSCKQSDINDLMVNLAMQGKRVVRLKSGDPAIFGRLTEEIAACRVAGIPLQIVPGISAAQGAAASLEVSLTERKTARRLQFITGHGDDGQLPADLCTAALADPTSTTIVYMPRKSLGLLVDTALRAGLPAETPAVAIIAATLPHEQRFVGTIATLPGCVAGTAQSAPMLVMIGRALRKASHAAPTVIAPGIENAA
jgi:uroporphyrin-III C-methyltransferase / precorrin-2 dehydrogenase / sirohydrochlorin ferrochelatase